MDMDEYLDIFVDEVYPSFLDKYMETKTMKRLSEVTQFCGSDYTRIYCPRFRYTRAFHSVVVAHMTWHFTHDVKATIAALLHDAATPCFAHAIDHMMDDRIEQESSERDIRSLLSQDVKLMTMLCEDGVSLDEVLEFSNYPVLENRSPGLCTDRLDGVLHTTYVWLNRGDLADIKRVYDGLVVLENEDGKPEIGFSDEKTVLEFVQMVKTYALELQGNRDKFVTEFVAQSVKKGISRGLFTLDDLYVKKENDIVKLMSDADENFRVFCQSEEVRSSDKRPTQFYVCIETKKRNVVPLVAGKDGAKRIDEVSKEAKKLYEEIEAFHDLPYAFVDGIL